MGRIMPKMGTTSTPKWGQTKIDGFGYIPDMGNRLRELRELRKLSIDQTAEKFGMSRSGYLKIERGERKLDNDRIQKAASVFGASAIEVLGFDREMVPLQGYVGAGQAVFHFNEDGGGYVEAPPGHWPGTVAVEVQGESMFPVFEPGTLLYYSRQLPPDEMLNRRCVVQLSDDRVLVKTLKKGSEPGLYRLTSTNAPDIDDVSVRWAAPIEWIKPRPF